MNCIFILNMSHKHPPEKITNTLFAASGSLKRRNERPRLETDERIQTPTKRYVTSERNPCTESHQHNPLKSKINPQNSSCGHIVRIEEDWINGRKIKELVLLRAAAQCPHVYLCRRITRGSETCDGVSSSYIL